MLKSEKFYMGKTFRLNISRTGPQNGANDELYYQGSPMFVVGARHNQARSGPTRAGANDELYY